MSNTEHACTCLLTFQDVLERTGYKSRSSLYRMLQKKRCPPAVIIGGGRVRWRADDIENWLKSLPAHTPSSLEGAQ